MTKVNCSKVEVRKSTLYPDGDGAFALQNFKEGDFVEYGLMRVVPINGHECPYIFTWSDDKTVWATASGCAMFYNSSYSPNTRMDRFFDENKFEIYALHDIEKGTELTHKYRSIEWRECFEDLRQLK